MRRAYDPKADLERQMAAVGLPTPTKEHRFHDSRRWRFDYAWEGQRIAFEFEGGAYTGGRHTRGKGFEGDCEKYSMAAILGWCVVRGTSSHVRSGLALRLIELAMKAREKPNYKATLLAAAERAGSGRDMG